jgi:hypothetical protein
MIIIGTNKREVKFDEQFTNIIGNSLQMHCWE